MADAKAPNIVDLAKAVQSAQEDHAEAQRSLQAAKEAKNAAVEALNKALGLTTEPEASRVGASFTREQVLRVLEDADDWLARADIADALGIPNDENGQKDRNRLGATLSGLQRDSKIATNGKQKIAARWATAENAEHWIATAED